MFRVEGDKASGALLDIGAACPSAACPPFVTAIQDSPQELQCFSIPSPHDILLRTSVLRLRFSANY